MNIHQKRFAELQEEVFDFAKSKASTLLKKHEGAIYELQDILKDVGGDYKNIDNDTFNRIYSYWISGSESAMSELGKVSTDVFIRRFKNLCDVIGTTPENFRKDYNSSWERAYELNLSEMHRKYAVEEWEILQSSVNYDKINSDLRKEYSRRESEASRFVTLNDNEKYLVLASAPVLWKGWESDSEAVVINKNGTKTLICFDYGKNTETSAKEFLLSKIEEYKKAIEETNELLKMVEE